MSIQTATVTELRRRTAELIAAAEAGHHQRITRADRATTVLVPADWYEYAAACVARVQQLDACFNTDTVRVPRPKTLQEMP